MGRPKGYKVTDNPKNSTFKFRMDNDTLKKLEEISEKTNQSKAEIIRKGIDLQYDLMNKK